MSASPRPYITAPCGRPFPDAPRDMYVYDRGGVYVANNAVVISDVTIGAGTSVWFACVIRGDVAPIVIGERVNIQDGTIIHSDTDTPHTIGNDVTIGHRAILHGKAIEDLAMIGMGAITLGGSVVGHGAIVASGAVVREDFQVPPRTIVAGVPAKVMREVSDEEYANMKKRVDKYVELARLWVHASTPGPDGKLPSVDFTKLYANTDLRSSPSKRARTE